MSSTHRLAVRRYWTGGRLTTLFVNPVLRETARSMSLWQPIGMRYWRILDREHRTQHAAPFSVLDEDATLTPATWAGQHAVINLSYADPFCIYNFWSEQGERGSTFGNIQTPTRVTRRDGLVLLDTTDLAVDVVFDGYDSYHWRDLDELQERADHDGYWRREEIPRIVGFGDQLIERWESRQWPFSDEAGPPVGLEPWLGPEALDPAWLSLDTASGELPTE